MNQFDDYKQSLRLAIREMKPRTWLYKLLKEELTARGWWKNRSRGRYSKKGNQFNPTVKAKPKAQPSGDQQQCE